MVHFVGTWFAPLIGRLLDRMGVRRMLWLEAGYIVLSFTAMGLLAGQLAGGAFSSGGWQTWLVFAAYILCVLFEQFMGLIWEGWGVQYVFYLAALSAILQLAAAGMVGKTELSRV